MEILVYAAELVWDLANIRIFSFFFPLWDYRQKQISLLCYMKGKQIISDVILSWILHYVAGWIIQSCAVLNASDCISGYMMTFGNVYISAWICIEVSMSETKPESVCHFVADFQCGAINIAVYNSNSALQSFSLTSHSCTGKALWNFLLLAPDMKENNFDGDIPSKD